MVETAGFVGKGIQVCLFESDMSESLPDGNCPGLLERFPGYINTFKDRPRIPACQYPGLGTYTTSGLQYFLPFPIAGSGMQQILKDQ